MSKALTSVRQTPNGFTGCHWFIILASFLTDLQVSLGQFTAKYEASGMKFSSSHCENVVRRQKRVDCPIQLRGRLLPQEKVWDIIHEWEIER